MSRCFPFPPPGYENKLGDHGELLAKEKHKEKKHKKEKKDREKKEGKKDKKEKDRSKDKHKEKKDRKEKHKDKKKEKDRDKSKNRTSDEGRIEGQASAHNEGKLGDNSRKTEEIKDSKYMEELGRRIRDEEKGATIRMVDSTGSIQKGIENIGSEIAISNSIHRRAEGMEIGAAVNDAIKKRMDSMATGTTAVGGTGQKGFENMRTGNANINSLQRRPEIMGTDAAVSGSVKRRIENTGTGSAISGMQDPIESITQTAVFQKKTESKSTGTAISGSLQKRMDSKGIGIAITSFGPNRTQSMVDSMAVEKERSSVSKLVPNLVGTEERKKNGMGKQGETDAEKRIEIDKERATGNKMLTNLIRMENRKINGLGKQVESIMEKRSETNDKAKEREPGRHKEKNREEKRSKRKDKSRHKEKEKETEKMREKGELGNKDKLKNTGKKDLVDDLSFKPAVPHIDTENNTVPDGTIKKRKDFEMNGALHENDERPHKLPRLASSSHLPVENGSTAELNHLITPNSFMRQRAFNSVSVKAERALDIQDRKANGIKEAHTSEVEMKSLSASATANGEVYAKPHPDTKFLTKVYSVPKMDEWPEYDDQEWLFSNDNNQQKPRPKLEVEEIPQVWAEAAQIKSADVFAMPYVVPY
ncbi:hypothetical protein J5N97_019837 [Dioscorea zingiberensis]|uniref:Myb-like protein X n=1 Tax=Dioscorea zingiberensis TaxID=325984 RepID=A0A9D5CEU6_9LILI|nr:hypothetical protein J5N97_019837 [Dioscorea zingiberensis]